MVLEKRAGIKSSFKGNWWLYQLVERQHIQKGVKYLANIIYRVLFFLISPQHMQTFALNCMATYLERFQAVGGTSSLPAIPKSPGL